MIGTKIYKPLQDNELPVYRDVQYEVEDPETGEKRIETRKELIGYEPNPAPNTLNKYSEAAHWCNENDAYIKEKPDYYEVLKNVRPEPTQAEKAEQVRAERDQLIDETTWLVERHKEERERNTASTTLTPDQYRALLDYRQALRDVPQQRGFPDSVTWPTAPVLAIKDDGLKSVGI